MAKYKLKKEARQFFDEKFHEKIYPLDVWKKEVISIKLLDEVDNVYIDFGIKSSESGTSLQGWCSDNGNPKAHFHFTVNVTDISNSNYESVNIPHVMDEMQKMLNKYFKTYTT